MTTHNKLAVMTLAALLSSASLAYGQTMENSIDQNSVQMISGGIGETDLSNINAVQKDYSLKLIFAEPNGEYLADVGLVIRDHAGNTVVDTASQGPVVLINLKPGTYTMASTVSGGETKTQKITVHGNKLSTYYVHLHSSES